MDRKTLTGAILAAAVGAMFLTTPVFAQDSSSGASQASVKCVGGNSCKAECLQRRKPQLQGAELL